MQFTSLRRTGLRRAGKTSATLLLTTTMLSLSGVAFAQEATAAATDDSDAIIVTATKRSENLQDVPIAITAFGTAKLEQMQVQKFEDYARYLPSVSYQTSGPGSAKVYFRGVASGENANHSASQPSVGIYLDEQPITTIQGALDVHVYDIARVEALAGPQGTLYGASSEAGTIRIITNKPDTSKFEMGADFEGNSVAKGGEGYTAEGFVNVPISDSMALRAVGWYKKDAGYIDNIAGSLTFPTSGVTLSNAPYVKKDYNDVETYGGRAALKIDLNDSWTVTPQVMGQKQTSHGSFAVESGLGDLQTMQFNPEGAKDNWYQAALTIEGKIGSFDVTYAGSYLKRKVTTQSDYADYAYFYDALFGSGAYLYDNAGNVISPNQYIRGIDRFSKQSHELRFTSPSDGVVRFVGGAFYQRQAHNIEQHYIIDNLSDDQQVVGTIDNIWLTKQLRVDRDYAAFGELTADVTSKLSVTMGARIYKYDNSLVGFFGYNNPGFSSNPVYACQGPAVVKGSPCTNLDKSTKDVGWLHKLNVTYKFTDDALIYGTASRGYRPGGINRRGDLPPYNADFIENYEIGWKTSWTDNRIRFNGAIYQLNWTDLQISVLGANGLTQIENAGRARIRGVEAELWTKPIDGLTLSGSGSYNDAKLTKDYCASDCSPGDPVLAPKGTRLPVTAKLKANAVARYEFPIGASSAHLQAAMVYEGKRTTDLRTVEGAIKGDLPSYTTVDINAGFSIGIWTAELFATNLFDKRAYSTVGVQCLETTCGDPDGVTAIGPKIYRTPIQPRTIGAKVGFKF
jgi:outer membrane receptor protein involved in Fe transport